MDVQSSFGVRLGDTPCFENYMQFEPVANHQNKVRLLVGTLVHEVTAPLFKFPYPLASLEMVLAENPTPGLLLAFKGLMLLDDILRNGSVDIMPASMDGTYNPNTKKSYLRNPGEDWLIYGARISPLILADFPVPTPAANGKKWMILTYTHPNAIH